LTSEAPSGRILSLSQHSSPFTVHPSPLTLTLDNSRGRFASPGAGELASLRFRSEIVLRLGYRTPAGAETSHAGTYWIDSWEYSSTPNSSLFTLHCLDGLGLLDRWSARFQMRWNQTAVDPTSVWAILYRLLARVGITLTNTPTQPQSSAVNNFLPDFTLQPGTQGDSAIRRLLAFVPDQLVFRSQEAFTKDPRPAEASVYAYSAINHQPSTTTHAILSGEYLITVHPSRTRAIGRDATGARIVQAAFDWSLLSLAIDILEQHYDPNLATATRAQERADALLREASLRAHQATIVTPANVGLEPLDVITATDPRCGITDHRYRVEDIRTDYDSRKERYDQRLTLAAP
jgi:hypothetical protein